MIDVNTKNKSFINMWRYLQDMGVDKCDFMLQLNDSSLEGFNQSDFANISDKDEVKDLMHRVIKECKNNIWFFFREVVNTNMFNSTQGNVPISHTPYTLTYQSMCLIYLYSKGASIAMPTHVKKYGEQSDSCKIKPLNDIYLTYILLDIYEAFINPSTVSNIRVSNLLDTGSLIYGMLEMWYDSLSINNLRLVNSLTGGVGLSHTISKNFPESNVFDIYNRVILFIDNVDKDVQDLNLINLITHKDDRRLLLGYVAGTKLNISSLENPCVNKLISDTYSKRINMGGFKFNIGELDPALLYILE